MKEKSNTELKQLIRDAAKELGLISLHRYSKQAKKNYNSLRSNADIITIDGLHFLETREEK